MSQNKNYIIPLACIGFLFFTVGFALGLNTYLIPLLQGSLKVPAGSSYLIVFVTFSAFLIFGYPAGWVIKKIGYKKTMALAFFIFAISFVLFAAAANMENLAMFLLASFVCGLGNTVEQAAINPYITILGPIDSAARRISIMGICNKMSYPVAAMLIAWLVGKPLAVAGIDDVIIPFFWIAAIFLVLGILVLFAPLDEIKATGEEEGHEQDCPYATNKTSIWQFPHLVFGCIALFLYVGVETLALQTSVDFAKTLGLSNPELYELLPSIGMVVGYIVGIFLIPKPLSQEGALRICSWLGVAGVVLTVFMPKPSIWFMPALALACSLMWPAIWPLAMADLGKFTKQGASLLVVTIFGGAVIPQLFGWLKGSLISSGMEPARAIQQSYWIALPCYLFILWYAYYGYKIRKS
jgi:FHS family L-fucose permease-like MFS transporter